jgi:hypothetical protein
MRLNLSAKRMQSFLTKKTSIMIVHPEGNWTSNPSLKSFIDLVLEKNIGIILLAPGQLPVSYQDRITHIELNQLYLSAFVKISDRLHFQSISKLYSHLLKIIQNYKIASLISVDRVGLIIGSLVCENFCVKHLHWSFEITFKKEVGAVYKSLEHRLLKRVDAVFIQDLLRADLFSKENECPRDKIHVVPLSSRGVVKKSLFRVRDHLGIPTGDKVCLFMGSTAKWGMLSNVLNTLHSWPKDWKLLVLSGNKIKVTHPIVSSNPKVFVQDNRYEFVDDMASIMSGINLGIGLYDPDYTGRYTGRNLEYLGLASGKINTYLRYNIPVVMNDKNLYYEHNKTWNFAMNIRGCVETELPEILNCYQKNSFQSEPRSFYENVIMFEKYEHKILNLIL